MCRVGFIVLAAALFAGCGGGSSDPDAGVPNGDGGADGGPDADPQSACAEFNAPAATVDTYPRTIEGTLAGAGAEHEVTSGSCAVEEAPFGVEAPGPDYVVALEGLAPGADYAVRLFSPSDLALYVAGDCGAGGPTGCLLYVDATTGSPERGVFTAPGDGRAFLLVDYFLPSQPEDAAFSLEVYAADCEADDECGGGEPFCVDRRCVECASSFHCGDAAAPVCDPRDNRCREGGDACTGDDPSPPEGGDDGPAGAPDATPPLGGSSVSDGHLCNEPTEELDHFAFTVEQNGESYAATLDWADAGADFDLRVFDESGRLYGASFWERPEQIALTNLPAGTYYASVDLFGSASAPALPYQLELVRASGPGCDAVSDCAAEFRNQIFRGECVQGACQFLEGGGGLPDGARCDSQDDCQSGRCTSFAFNADSDSRSVCTHACQEDGDCDDLGAGYVCTDFLVENLCVQTCSMDEHCPTLLGVEPAAGPWHYLTCEGGSGSCRL